MVYWSHSQDDRATWRPLADARERFGEALGEGSEPDIIIVCDKDLDFLEAKLTSPNKTKPRSPKNQKKYFTGAGGWYAKVFGSQASFEEIAIKKKVYELMRLWLIGTWIAANGGKKFHLVNLVCDGKEEDIEDRFGPCTIEDQHKKFRRLTWESIFAVISDVGGQPSLARDQLLDDVREKTLGYRAEGTLSKAFGYEPRH